MEEKIYKIVKIVDDENIVINAGTENGIKRGMKFEIFETRKSCSRP